MSALPQLVAPVSKRRLGAVRAGLSSAIYAEVKAAANT